MTTENLVLKSSNIFKYIIQYFQGLLQKHKVDTDGEEGTQINNVSQG